MSTPKVSSLLYKRDIDYNNITNGIIDTVGDNLIKAVQFFLNKKRELTIEQIALKDNLPGIALIKFYMKPIIGDTVLTAGGEVVINENNLNLYFQIVEIIISLQSLDINSAYVMYKDICNINSILSTKTPDVIDKLMKYCSIKIDENSITVNDLDSKILDNPDFCDILDVLTKPKDIDILGFDVSKMTQYQKNMLKIYEKINDKNYNC